MNIFDELQKRADAYTKEHGKPPKQIDVTWDEYKSLIVELKKNAPKGWNGIPRCGNITLRVVRSVNES